jgi:diguanylate cyclase (GGDEF)-like protein/PAS domain S-box-containing protein
MIPAGQPPHPLLVVDDDATNRDLLSRRLERRGYRVETAASGQQALDSVADHVVAMVLLDVQMPEMSGLEVLQTLRRTWPQDRLPILMVTAKDQSEDIVTALEMGANDYVTKPIDFPVAFARIRTLLSRREAEEQLRASEERYALAAKGANDGLWDWEVTTGHLHYSERWKSIVGCEDHEIGTSAEEWFGRVHPEDLPGLRRDLDDHLSGRTPHFQSEHRMRHQSGAFRWVLTRGLAVRDSNGVALRMAGSQSDITEGKVVDALTGLPNRMLLIDRLERLLQHERAHPGSERFAVLYMDLDGFKLVNDSFGHPAGDTLLQAVARRLEGSLRNTDVVARLAETAGAVEHTLARLGGDEFVVVLHDIRGGVDATRVAERILRALRPAFEIAGCEVFTSASIGIAVGGARYTGAGEILRDADTAMYRAKALGKGRFEVFDAAMREEVTERLKLDTALRLAVDRHEFLPYYQPIVDLGSGNLVGFEALIRWKRGNEVVEPGGFLSVIEENGLALPVGRRFFRDVCQQLRAWQTTHPDAGRLSVSVNFAGAQFVEIGLLDYLLETVEDAGLSPGQIVVEITESTAIVNFAHAIKVLSRIRQAGLSVVLDDFGTGYSSLSCLHELPITGLKLDRSFISKEGQHPAILRAVVLLAQHLELTVTAEGVETVAQYENLRNLGCGFAQGFLFERAVDAVRAGALVRDKRHWLPVGPSQG